jgi:hypothetical protein
MKDLRNHKEGVFLEKNESGTSGSRGKIGARVMKRLIEREVEERGVMAGLSMEAILLASSSLVGSGGNKANTVLTVEERALGTNSGFPLSLFGFSTEFFRCSETTS